MSDKKILAVLGATGSQDEGLARAALEQARTATVAAKEAGVAHVVWSTLEDTKPARSRASRPRTPAAPRTGSSWRVGRRSARRPASRVST